MLRRAAFATREATQIVREIAEAALAVPLRINEQTSSMIDESESRFVTPDLDVCCLDSRPVTPDVEGSQDAGSC